MRRLVIALALALGLTLTSLPAAGASSERIYEERVCHNIARWSVDVFDTITQNPGVTLSGTDPLDGVAFEFIREWVRGGKTREELYAYTLRTCLDHGVPV